MLSSASRCWLAAGILLVAGAVRGAEIPAPVTRPAEAAAPPDAAARLQAFMAEEDASRRADLAGKFAAVAPKNWDDLKALLHRTAPRADLKPGRQEFVTRGEDGFAPIQYVLRVPAAYQGHEPQGWPLVIALPGRGGNAAGILATVEGLLGPDVERYLMVGVNPPDSGPYRPARATAEYALSVLSDVRHVANVNSDRTVLLGVSKGGFSAWASVLFAPGEWAGAVPISSFPITDAGQMAMLFYLPNVLHVSIQSHWGAKDIEPGWNLGIGTYSRDVAAEMKRLGAAKFEGIEYPDEGHNVHVKADKVREFVAKVRRDPFPTECRLLFHRLYQGRLYYVRATTAAREDFDFIAKRHIQVGPQPDAAHAYRAMFQIVDFELTARLPAGRNTIAILTKDLKEIELELPAEKLDFTQPIRITLNGRSLLESARKVDWAEMLETARRTYDFERLIAGRLRINVASGAAR